MELLLVNTEVYSFLNDEYRNDKEIVRKTISKKDTIFQQIPNDLKINKEFILELIQTTVSI